MVRLIDKRRRVNEFIQSYGCHSAVNTLMLLYLPVCSDCWIKVRPMRGRATSNPHSEIGV